MGDLAAVDVPGVMASGAGVAVGFPVVAMDDPAHPSKPNPTATATHLSIDSHLSTSIECICFKYGPVNGLDGLGNYRRSLIHRQLPAWLLLMLVATIACSAATELRCPACPTLEVSRVIDGDTFDSPADRPSRRYRKGARISLAMGQYH